MDSPENQVCEVCWLGTVAYDRAWRLQDRLAAEVADRVRPPVLLLLEHPHVYTAGRRSQAENILWSEDERAARGVDLRWIDRGGDVTYHGPGQLVGYPILPLAPAHWLGDRLPQTDYVGYLRRLEGILIQSLAKFGLVTGQIAGLTGVWVMAETWGRCARCDPRIKPRPAKIASIGVKVDARGVTRHGFALNIAPDHAYWEGIVACGLEGVMMADLADFLDPPPSVEQVARLTAEIFGQAFGFSMRWITASQLLVD